MVWEISVSKHEIWEQNKDQNYTINRRKLLCQQKKTAVSEEEKCSFSSASAILRVPGSFGLTSARQANMLKYTQFWYDSVSCCAKNAHS